MTDLVIVQPGDCPTCGPTATEPHPRLPRVARCDNCKAHLGEVRACATSNEVARQTESDDQPAEGPGLWSSFRPTP